MGCGESRVMFYTIQYCSLEPLANHNDIFKIQLIAEENLQKIEGLKLLKQIENSNVPEITKFMSHPNIKTNTIFYFYFRDELLLKTYNQSINYVPYNLPLLKKVILLSVDSAPDFPIQMIENETKHLEENKFIDYQLDLREKKSKIDEANKSNITKDSLSMKEDSVVYDNESVYEKPEELVICEEITKETYNHMMNKFKNDTQGNESNRNYILETSAENHNIKEKKNNNNIKTVKVISSNFENINIFYDIMNFLSDKDIKKFSFYNNYINNEFEGWDAISDFFGKDYSLRYVDLHNSNIYDYHLNSIIRPLIDKRIRYLDLSENFLTIDGVDIIINFLKYNKTLQKLNLSRNAQCQFKPEGVKLLTEALISKSNIEFLDFSYMNLTGCGEYIGNFITQNKSIESIILRNVMLNTVDFKNIFVPLKTNNVLKEIDISLNDMGGDKSLQFIADAIKENTTLKAIKMDKININNDNYKIIFDAIEVNKKLYSYTLNYNSKIKPMIVLNFFIKQKQVKYLEFEPYDKDNPEDKKKELTLEEKKMFAKLKTERPDMKFVYK